VVVIAVDQDLEVAQDLVVLVDLADAGLARGAPAACRSSCPGSA
jgi:hypothetical protein